MYIIACILIDNTSLELNLIIINQNYNLEFKQETEFESSTIILII